jgi:hypothetical protein
LALRGWAMKGVTLGIYIAINITGAAIAKAEGVS